MNALTLPCTSCGPTAPMNVDDERDVVVCARCGEERGFQRRGLFLVTGAPSTGKSTLVRSLTGELQRTPVFDTDLFGPWSNPDWAAWAATWLLVAHGLAQSGLPTVLCGYGINRSDARRLAPHVLLGPIHALNLDLADDDLRTRLQRRSDYDADRVERKVARAAFLRADADVNLDVGDLGPGAIADAVREWIRTHVRYT